MTCRLVVACVLLAGSPAAAQVVDPKCDNPDYLSAPQSEKDWLNRMYQAYGERRCDVRRDPEPEDLPPAPPYGDCRDHIKTYEDDARCRGR